jgi:hypothetical protein
MSVAACNEPVASDEADASKLSRGVAARARTAPCTSDEAAAVQMGLEGVD